LLRKTGVVLTEDELSQIKVADFGLSELEQSGGQILTLVDTAEIAVKLIVLFPGQCLPEHRHPPLGDYPGKAETLRCEWGILYLCEEGDATPNSQARPPEHRQHTYTVWRESVLHPGNQRTMPPNTLHWFQSGPEGAVVWSFSSRATDVQDVFTDPDIQRQTVVVEDKA
jgi:D-lyxose ketol-isomerase